jgi:hypothetical protein
MAMINKTNKDTLLELVNKLVEEKTFSVEGVKAIENIRQQVLIDTARIKELEEDIKRYYDKNTELMATEVRLKKEVEEWKAKEKAIADREKTIHVHEIRTAVAEAIASTMREMNQLVFKNTIIRENVQRTVVESVPGMHTGAYPTTSTRQGDTDIKTTEKE